MDIEKIFKDIDKAREVLNTLKDCLNMDNKEDKQIYDDLCVVIYNEIVVNNIEECTDEMYKESMKNICEAYKSDNFKLHREFLGGLDV